MSAENHGRTKLIAAAAVLSAVVVLAILAVFRPEKTTPPNGDPVPPPPPGAALESLLARLPESVFLLLAADDLGEFAAELKRGPLGRIAEGETVKRFLKVIREEAAGEMASLSGALDAAEAALKHADGAAALFLWEVEGDRGPALAFVVRVKPDATETCLKDLDRHLAVPGEKVREEPLGAGGQLRTIAPEEREGLSWGSSGDWVAVVDSTSGCREILRRLGGEPGAIPAGVKGAFAAARKLGGSMRLFGCMDASDLVTRQLRASLGLETAGWVTYSASAGPEGRWTERLLLMGRSSGGGIPAGLASGGRRELLAGLPASTLVCFSCNVADGGRLWAEIERAASALRLGDDLDAASGEMTSALGMSFGGELAPSLEGELTIAWAQGRGGLFPLGLLGAAFTPGSAEKFEKPGEAVLKLPLFGDGGEVQSAEYQGSRMHWLSGHEYPNVFCPQPCYAFRKDLLVASAATVHLKEFLADRGGNWLDADGVRRLSSGMMSLRVALDRCYYIIAGLVTLQGGRELLSDRALAEIPMPEEIAPHLGCLEVVAGRGPGGPGGPEGPLSGLLMEVRGPAPLGPTAIVLLLTLF